MVTVLTGTSAQVPKGITVGQTSDLEAATGCSVLLCPQGAVGAVAVYGGAPATRETDLLAPDKMVQSVHALVLSGGSAYGLDAASGVMRYLEEKKLGVPFSGAVVPIVVAASLFDLDVGSSTVRPDANMGYAAASLATATISQTGTVGAGTGATVGRFMGPTHAMKGGLGAASVCSGELIVTALVAVNSLGNVFDRAKGEYLAGAHVVHDGKKVIVEPLDTLPQILSQMSAENTNTTIGAVVTNARLDKAQTQRVAGMSHDGLARSIYPVHTSFDGDALFALATGEVEAQSDLVGTLAAVATEQAVLDAVRSAESLHGFPSHSSIEETPEH